RWLYADSLFDAATIARFAESFATLLSSIVDAPTQSVQSLPLLPAADTARLAQWSRGPQREIPALCAHQWFERRAEATPDALAVRCDGEALSYAELNAKANRLAHYLITQGVEPDQLVGLCVERSLDMLVGVLGILKAGAGYLPLDPEYPEERIADMLADARIAHVVTQTGVLEALPLLGELQVLPLDGALGGLLLDGQPGTNPVVGVMPRHLAYAIYTSGSTGKPKGVLLEHRGLVNLALNQQRLFDLDAASRVLAFASLSFDGSSWEWIMALASGASLHVVRPEQRQSAQALADFLVRERITHAAIPPALLAQVDIDRDYALKVLIVAGEACEERLAWAWAQRCRVCNSYGPSEATVAATHADIRRNERITLGTALANVELHVLNAHGQPQPVGVAGELYLGGAGLARGYLNRPQLQAERFVAAPHDAAQRRYRTGDLVAWTAAGELQFLGRIDDQVKIRGFRIELGEIETQLLLHAAVREAVVVVRQDKGTPQLVAYVVASGDDALPNEVLLAKEWRAHLKQSLPDYMLPAAFVVMDALPLTPNGKVDKRKLPEPDYQAQQVYVAPETDTERQLAAIWQQVLRVGQVGIHDNFFEIGGDSILSIQVVSRANQAGIGVTTKQLFEAQTIAELARVACEQLLVQAPQEAIDGGFALLPIDHLFLTGELRDRHHYNQAVLLETPAGFDASALRAVIAAVYARHDALRLRFVERDGEWQATHIPLDDAMIAASCIVEVAGADAGPADWSGFVTARCAHWQGAFDLATGPLLRAVYFPPVHGGAGRLLLLAHHIVVDGVSWRVLLADVEQAQAQHRNGEAIALAPKTSSYQQWGAALADYAHGDALRAEKDYWLAQCGERVAPLPVDRKTAEPGAIGTTRTVAISLTAEETRALQQECPAAYRTQINELLLAGVYLGVRRWSGADTLRLRLEGHGRESLFDGIDLTQTVGWFTSVYPLTLRCASAEAGAVIKAIKEQNRAIPHHGIGYGILRYLTRDADILAASAGNEPELEFNYLGQFDQVLNADTAFKAAEESVGPKIGPHRARMHHLGLSGKTFGGELHFVLDYSTDQYDDATMQQLAGLIEDGLRDVIDHCRERGAGAFTPSDFPLAQIDQARLDRWQADYPGLTRLYPATPLQAGLLFESLLRPSTYIVQTFPLLRGALDPAAFRRAWQQVIARHDIFRTAFVGEGDQVHQLVSAQAELAWHEEDWRALPAPEQQARFDAYRSDDRRRGVDFATAPLLRIALFRYGEDRWQLLWTHHHILSDGWSSPLVYRDVIALYQAQVEGRDARLPAAPAFETYIAWQQRQDRAAAREYWRGVLGDIEAPTPLVVDRGGETGGNGEREQRLLLSAAQTSALQQLAQRLHTTLNTLVQWCWGNLLHRYSGERDVVFGATISGRPAEVPGVEEMVGLFINTIPVRISFDAEMPVADALQRLQREFQEATAAGYLSLSEIQRQSRVRPGTALFDSLLVFENLPIDARLDAETARPALDVEQGGATQHTQYALTVIAIIGAELQIRCSYDTARFGEAAIARLLAHFGRILDRLPAMALHGAPAPLLQDDDERAKLAAWNDTAAGYDRGATIHGLVEAQAARTPDAVAVVLGDAHLSYAQLDARANRLAHHLIAQGVRPGDRVGLCVARSFDLVVGVLAVLKAGAAYVPLDPAYPAARLAYLIEDSGVAIVLTQAPLARGLASDRVRAVLTDDEAAFSTYPESGIAAGTVSADGAAFVMYTSGSTGQPKGVVLPHRTMTNLMTGMARRYAALAAVTPTLQFASMNFDMSLYEITSALFTGSPLVLIAEEDRLDLPRLIAVLRRQAVGRVYLPTAMLNQFAQAVLASGAELPALRVLQVAGEALSITPAVRDWAARSGCLLLNLYGPTESHVVTEHALHGDPTQWPALPSIGRPVDNVQIHILDDAQRPQPVGVTGELYIGGDNLALGYLGRDELTAAKFVTVDIDGVGAQRLYRTGDLARRSADGCIDYIGRADTQVKLRGFRVEPGEIETVLARHDGVAEAVVVALGDGDDKQLVAYVVAKATADEALLTTALRPFLQRELPHYMIPSVFVPLAALPLNANGKVDRRALPAPQRAAPPDFVAPATPTEMRLARIWQDLLKLERVGANERFFELGGHSLLATRVVGAVLTEFGCVLRLQDVFAYQALAELAQLIDLLQQPAGVENGTAASAGQELEETEW
ncbi:MAG TPA: amino acid adenylation domain-containing protein, partial [Tahibacter sp.]|uniref:non-ribosomal peptide synthetase n=1 Tax=Tahibacter sp. TaxID=2056211 RepID=UPI002C7B6FDE